MISHPMRSRGTSSGFGLALAAAAEACGIGLLGLSGWFVAACAVAGSITVSAFSYLPPSGGVQAFALGRIASTYASRVVLHSAALRRITEARLGFYDRTADPGARSGESLDKVMADADTAGMALIRATAPQAAAAVMTVAGGAAMLLAGYPAAAAILAAAAATCVWLTSRVARVADDGGAARRELRTELVGAVEARSEMASLGATGQLEKRTLEQLAAFETSRLRQTAVGARGTGLARAITAAALLLVIVSAERQGAPVAIVVFFGLLTAGVMTGVERLVLAAQAGRLAWQAGRRLKAAETEPSRTTPGLQVTYEHGELAVSEYRLSETPTRIGRPVEFRVLAGATVILTGASGTGKTTLLEAIQAALREQTGSVVTAVRAEDYTFTGTVADNIRLADPAAGDEAIADLLDAMMLNVAPDTRLGSGGRLLSGGEERRLHIARALAPLPDVLIVDEPTTGLDGATATHVMAEIRRRLPDSVLVMAMHEPAPEFLTEGVRTVSLN